METKLRALAASMASSFGSTGTPLNVFLAPQNRHRGESHLSSPATPPYMRVRIRRFSSVELAHGQPWQTERVKVSNGKS